MKKFLIIMLVLVMSVSAIIGITSSVKHEENRKDEDLIVKASYEQLISDLESDIALSLENVAALKAEIELNGLTISSLTTSVVSYKNQVASLENSVEKYEEDLVVKTSELEAKTGEIAELTTQLESSEETNSELTAQLETLTTEKSVLETEIAELSAEKENLETLIDEKEAEITELSNSISAKNIELETLANQVAEKQTTIDGLNTQVTNLLVEIENLESDVFDKDETIENLNNQVLGLQTQVSELNTQIEELDATIFDLNTRIDILEEQLANNGTGEKDPNKTYIESFSNVSKFTAINDDCCLVYGKCGSTNGTYVMFFKDYSVQFIIAKNLNKVINLKSGAVLIGNISCTYNFDLDSYEEALISDTIGIDVYYEFDCGKILFHSGSDAAYVFDIENNEFILLHEKFDSVASQARIIPVKSGNAMYLVRLNASPYSFYIYEYSVSDDGFDLVGTITDFSSYTLDILHFYEYQDGKVFYCVNSTSKYGVINLIEDTFSEKTYNSSPSGLAEFVSSDDTGLYIKFGSYDTLFVFDYATETLTEVTA